MAADKEIIHKILMKEAHGGGEVVYSNVTWYEGIYGCLIRLHMEDGSTATFEKDDWCMFDLMPTLGWNDHATNILQT